jgi:alpha-galactosidase
MCLVSGHADVFADELIRAYREFGVTYFKWDAVGQYGCDSPDHDHGDASVTPEERAQSYGFELPRQMARIAEKLQAACPEAIVDFDVTESGRAFGLGFLSAGKYFLINNGPYYQNYDVPINPDKDNWNLFFYKGPARAWIARTPLSYDSWIPSSLFLTHYLPDDPYESQIVNIASLILGQNGIWGDLPRISSEGVGLFGHLLGLYKQVRDDITESYPVTSGPVSGASEVHEKIAARSGRGAIVLFSTAAGPVTYVSTNRPNRTFTATQGVSVKFDSAGRAVITVPFDKPGATEIRNP